MAPLRWNQIAWASPAGTKIGNNAAIGAAIASSEKTQNSNVSFLSLLMRLIFSLLHNAALRGEQRYYQLTALLQKLINSTHNENATRCESLFNALLCDIYKVRNYHCEDKTSEKM